MAGAPCAAVTRWRVTAIMQLVISVLHDHLFEVGGQPSMEPQRLTAIERLCPGMVM